MLVTRGARLLKLGYPILKISKSSFHIQPAKCSAHDITYRIGSEPHRFSYIGAKVLGGIMWWWIFWHLYHEFGHIVGDYDYPDPSKWTDEELGIPPEDDLELVE
ncbi:NADH dehydrogenase [ubiquinone] 1 beta subcomplex subunit 2, mitochondrial-like [Prorops nasuta]|uniref:NADH dehydrogenase [ubiquinone] 1 beta subcomplex subunit 2, mitochondrial-like n=1 Tax=Prorops nasuta TaxID=863751 RepID=UPI0034CD6D8E